MHADRHVRQRAREHQRTLQHLLRGNPVRHVDDLRLRRDPLDHAVAGADEVVLKPEVAQEGDEHAREVTAASRPATSCVSASATTRTPASRAVALVCGPMLTAGSSTPSRPKARAVEADASTTRSPVGQLVRLELARPIERDEGRLELVDQQRARTLGRRKEHASGGTGQLGEQAFLGRDRRNEVGPAERRRRRGADRSDSLRRSLASAAAARAPRSGW